MELAIADVYIILETPRDEKGRPLCLQMEGIELIAYETANEGHCILQIEAESSGQIAAYQTYLEDSHKIALTYFVYIAKTHHYKSTKPEEKPLEERQRSFRETVE